MNEAGRRSQVGLSCFLKGTFVRSHYGFGLELNNKMSKVKISLPTHRLTVASQQRCTSCHQDHFVDRVSKEREGKGQFNSRILLIVMGVLLEPPIPRGCTVWLVGAQLPNQGSNLHLLKWKCRVLTTDCQRIPSFFFFLSLLVLFCLIFLGILDARPPFLTDIMENQNIWMNKDKKKISSCHPRIIIVISQCIFF